MTMKRNLAALLILGIFCFLSCGERETKLFNGKNLDGWAFHLAPDSDVPATDVFGVKDGVITIAGQPFGYTPSLKKCILGNKGNSPSTTLINF